MTQVAVIDTGVSNLASVLASINRLGAQPVVCRNAQQAAEIERWCLPGVGSFQAGIAALRAGNWEEALRRHVQLGRPLLAICLGMQLLTDGSDEAPEEVGLGILSGRCEALRGSAPLPQLGWNHVRPGVSDGKVRDGTAAFANSYALMAASDAAAASWSRHGTDFVAAVELESIVACQFHPELSGPWGESLMARALHLPCAVQLTERESSADAEVAPNSASTDDSPRQPIANDTIIRMVPCLDVLDGRVVKGIQFKGLRDMGSPAEQAGLYQEQGADEIVLLDIGASPADAEHQLRSVREVRRRLAIPLTVGGGVRQLKDAQRLLNAGADKVAVNSAALAQPYLISELAQQFGRQCIVLAVDAQRASGQRWVALSHGGRKVAHQDAVAWMQQGQILGAGEILLTSWDKDGTRDGADLPLLRAARSAVQIPIISSGGIGTEAHVFDAVQTGADAVLAASIFHEATLRVGDLKSYLAARGIEVRR